MTTADYPGYHRRLKLLGSRLRDGQLEDQLSPGPDLLRNGADPLLLLRELSLLGELRSRRTCRGFRRSPNSIRSVATSVGRWTLTTAAPREGIGDVFLFVEDECELTIEPSRLPGPGGIGRYDAAPEA